MAAGSLTWSTTTVRVNTEAKLDSAGSSACDSEFNWGGQEYELQRASLHAWSRTEGGQLQAAVGIFYESDG